MFVLGLLVLGSRFVLVVLVLVLGTPFCTSNSGSSLVRFAENCTSSEVDFSNNPRIVTVEDKHIFKGVDVFRGVIGDDTGLY